MISLLIFCLIESKSRIWVLGSLALVVALILLPLYLCCFKIYFIRYENCNSCFSFIRLFLLSIWLVNLSPSLCFDSLCILACEVALDVAYHWVLAVSFFKKIFYCILGFGVYVQNMQDSCIGTHMAVYFASFLPFTTFGFSPQAIPPHLHLPLALPFSPQ